MTTYLTSNNRFENFRSQIGRFWHSDVLVCSMLALLVLVTRVPFFTTVLYNWDSGNFALATRTFDVTQHHPQPPGYFLYVMTSGALVPLVGDTNLALVLVALVLSMGGVAATFMAGSVLFSRSVGLIAALFVMSSVTFWSYGGIALAYPALACFSATVAWLAFRTGWQKAPGAWVWLSLAYAVGSGFRPDLLLFLGLLWFIALVRAGMRQTVLGSLIAVAGVLAWLVPTILLSGGLTAYLAVFSAYGDRDVLDRYSSTRNGLLGLVANARDVASYAWYSLYGTAVPLAAGALGLLWLRPKPDSRWLFMSIWLVPMLVFYTVIHIGDPGYAFTFLPALSILAAVAITGLLRRPQWVAAAAAGVVLVNSGVYLLYPRQLTSQGIRAADRSLATRLAYVQTLPTDGSVLVLSYDSFRQLQFYAPQLTSNLWVDIFAAAPQATSLGAEVRSLLVFDERLMKEAGPRPTGETVAGGMTRIPVSPGQVLTFGAGVLRLE